MSEFEERSSVVAEYGGYEKLEERMEVGGGEQVDIVVGVLPGAAKIESDWIVSASSETVYR